MNAAIIYLNFRISIWDEKASAETTAPAALEAKHFMWLSASKYTRHQLSWGVWAAVGRVSSVPSQTCLKEESSQGKVTEGSSHEHSCSCCCFLWVVCKSGSKSHLCNKTWEQQIIHCLNCLWLRFNCKLGRIAAWWGRSELGSSTTARVAPVMHLRK